MSLSKTRDSAFCHPVLHTCDDGAQGTFSIMCAPYSLLTLQVEYHLTKAWSHTLTPLCMGP